MTEDQIKTRNSNFKKFSNKHSMNIAATKGACKVYFTDKIVGYNEVPTAEQFKRDSTKTLKDLDKNILSVVHNKKGDYKKKYYPIWQRKFNNIIDAWKDTSDFLQTSAGLTHDERNVVYLDFDIDSKIAKTHVEDVCKKLNFPLPTFILSHKNISKKDGCHHGDAMWVLTRPIAHDAAISLNKYMNGIFTLADPQFKGWQIKNAFNDAVTQIGGTKEVYDPELFIDFFNIQDNKTNIDSPLILSSNYITKVTHSDANNSRNNYIYRNADKLLFRWMNTHNGMAPTIETAEELCKPLIAKASAATGKDELYPMNEFSAVIKACLQFTTENYSADYMRVQDQASAKLSAAARKNSEIIRKANMFNNVMLTKRLLERNSSVIKIAKTTGLSRKQVYVYKNITEEQLSILEKNAEAVLECYNNGERTLKMEEIINTLEMNIDFYKNNISFILSSNYITKVTHSADEVIKMEPTGKTSSKRGNLQTILANMPKYDSHYTSIYNGWQQYLQDKESYIKKNGLVYDDSAASYMLATNY